MTLRVTFDLASSDLKHFQLIMREARDAAKNWTHEQIIASARKLLEEVRSTKVPSFISDRLQSLEMLTDMVTDDEWRLPPEEMSRVLNALAYFTEPEDLIPDHIPGLGFLDDAIMIELVVRELKHEIKAYEDFCAFRTQEERRRRSRGREEQVTREEWLSARRAELHDRMRRRRTTDRKRKRSSGRSPFSLF